MTEPQYEFCYPPIRSVPMSFYLSIPQRSEAATNGHMMMSFNGGDVTALSAGMTKLQSEKEALEKILVQKEKQIQAMSEVDPVNSDIGALQLGTYYVCRGRASEPKSRSRRDRRSQAFRCLGRGVGTPFRFGGSIFSFSCHCSLQVPARSLCTRKRCSSGKRSRKRARLLLRSSMISSTRATNVRYK